MSLDKLANSAETALTTETIYIPLLDEGLTVSRPTHGIPQGESRYIVLPTSTYSADIETWQFVPGTVVTCIDKESDGRSIKLAVEASPRRPSDCRRRTRATSATVSDTTAIRQDQTSMSMPRHETRVGHETAAGSADEKIVEAAITFALCRLCRFINLRRRR